MAPRTKPATARRGDLLDAGIAVFGQKGVPEATIEDVTSAAGVAKGTFYLYFASKDDLVAALQERFHTEFAARQAAALASLDAQDWRGRLDAWVAAGIEAYGDNQRVHDVLFRHDTATMAAHAEHAWSGEGLVAGLAELLDRGTQAEAFTVADPRMTAFLLYGMFHWAGDHTLHCEDDAEVRRVVTLTQALFRRAVAPRG